MYLLSLPWFTQCQHLSREVSEYWLPQVTLHGVSPRSVSEPSFDVIG
jgi:hypothetical protein